MRFRKKSDPAAVVSVVSFDELLRFGVAHGANLDTGWFEFNGHRIVRDRDDLLVGVARHRLRPGDVLIIEGRRLRACAPDSFEATYEPHG